MCEWRSGYKLVQTVASMRVDNAPAGLRPVDAYAPIGDGLADSPANGARETPSAQVDWPGPRSPRRVRCRSSILVGLPILASVSACVSRAWRLWVAGTKWGQIRAEFSSSNRKTPP